MELYLSFSRRALCMFGPGLPLALGAFTRPFIDLVCRRSTILTYTLSLGCNNISFFRFQGLVMRLTWVAVENAQLFLGRGMSFRGRI